MVCVLNNYDGVIKEMRKIHNKKWECGRIDNSLPIESDNFDKQARFVVFDGYMAITTKSNGVLIGDTDKLKVLLNEALDVIAMYEK